MARMKLAGFPDPFPGRLWCSACAVLAKGTLLAPQREQIEAGLADDEREVFRVGVKGAADLLEEAVAEGPCLLLSGAVVPLCWLHLPAIDGNAPPPEQEAPGARGLQVPGQDWRRRGLS